MNYQQRMIELCLRYFESYKRCGEPGIVCVTVYLYLQRIGVINQPKEYKMNVYNEVKSNFPNISENRIRFESMKICLKTFFQELINKNLELKDVMI